MEQAGNAASNPASTVQWILKKHSPVTRARQKMMGRTDLRLRHPTKLKSQRNGFSTSPQVHKVYLVYHINTQSTHAYYNSKP